MSSVEVQCWVEVDLGEITTDDLTEELEKRNARLPPNFTHTQMEREVAMDRFFQERRQAVTRGFPASECERDFWFKCYSRDL